jgi:hypothetical protein
MQCLLSFGAESFVVQFELKNLNLKIHKYNFVSCFVSVWNMVAHIDGGT